MIIIDIVKNQDSGKNTSEALRKRGFTCVCADSCKQQKNKTEKYNGRLQLIQRKNKRIIITQTKHKRNNQMEKSLYYI